MTTSALYSIISKPKISKTRGGVVVTKTGASRTTRSVSVEAGGVAVGERSGADEGSAFSGYVEEGPSSLGDVH